MFFFRAAQQGNPFAQTELVDRKLCGIDEEGFAWLEKAAVFGEARDQHLIGLRYEREGVVKSDEKYLRGAIQKHLHSCYQVANSYQKGIGCQKNLPLSAVFYLEYGDSYCILPRLTAEFDDPVIRLQELFVYGKGLKKDAELRAKVGEENCANAIRIFEESTNAARKAVLCFIWICKQSSYLNRDVARLVGKMVFESREDPSIWNIGITETTAREQNKGKK